MVETKTTSIPQPDSLQQRGKVTPTSVPRPTTPPKNNKFIIVMTSKKSENQSGKITPTSVPRPTTPPKK